MKRRTRILNLTTGILALVIGAIVAGLPVPENTGAQDGAPKISSAPAPTKTKGVDPARVMGVRACLGCHGSETLAWMRSTHHNTHLLLRAPNAKKYADELGIKPAKVREASTCIRCHATSQTDLHGTVRATTGVSCESCHGASGGDDGWLNAHAVYGRNGTSFEQESDEHLKWRIDRVEKAGMVRSGNVYATAVKCLECHLVQEPDLVNAGHKIGKSFELLGRTSGEVRHNFHEDQHTNAIGPSLWARRTGGKANVLDRKKFTVGLLAEIELSLAVFSTLEEESDYSGALVERAAGAWGFLAEVSEELEDDFPEKLLEVVEELEEVEDLDVEDEDNRAQAAEWAEMIGKLAQEYSAGDAEELEIFDEVLSDLVEASGKPYERK